MKDDTVAIYVRKKDAGLIAQALREYQKNRGINIYNIKWGINKLRLYFEETKQ